MEKKTEVWISLDFGYVLFSGYNCFVIDFFFTIRKNRTWRQYQNFWTCAIVFTNSHSLTHCYSLTHTYVLTYKCTYKYT